MVEGHTRLISPISSLGYAVIGLAILISGTFSRRTQSKRILVAALLVIGLQGAMLGMENATAKNLSLVPVLYLLGILPVAGGFMLMLHTPKSKRREAFEGAG